jgi:hypothetical protein
VIKSHKYQRGLDKRSILFVFMNYPGLCIHEPGNEILEKGAFNRLGRKIMAFSPGICAGSLILSNE